MVRLLNKETGALLGSVSDGDLQLLVDQLEEEDAEDTDIGVSFGHQTGHPFRMSDRNPSEGARMKGNYTAVVKKSGKWGIGWIEEVPGVNCQETTREKLMESLRLTLREALEMNRRDAREAAGKGFEEEPIAL